MKQLLLCLLIPFLGQPIEILGLKPTYRTTEKINYVINNRSSTVLHYTIALEANLPNEGWHEMITDATTAYLKTAVLYKIKPGRQQHFVFSPKKYQPAFFMKQTKIRFKVSYGNGVGRVANVAYSSEAVIKI